MSEAEALSPEKREQVLRGATSVFARDGYEGASMSRIALEAGVSKGTLYNYFTSKAELFAAYVGQQCSAKLAQVFADSPHDDATPAEMLRVIGTRMIEMMLSPTAQTIYRVVTSEAPKFPELARAFYDAGPAQAIGALSDWLAAETRAGRLRVPDPRFAAEQFFALCQTRVCLRRTLHMDPVTPPEDITRVVAAAVDMFLRSYAA
jgi:TetR/AcrR family transcriptional regulator, mexJK operon transcriptional repressor